MGGVFDDEPISGTTTIWEDKLRAIAYSHDAMVDEKTRHIDPKWHFLKDRVEHGTIRLRYLPTGRMVADMFTKPLPRHAPTRHQSTIMGGADPMQRFLP
jgi:hypothetical protein